MLKALKTLPFLGLSSRKEPFRALRLGWPVSAVWLLPDAPDGPVLIDVGFYTQRSALLLGIQAHGFHPKDVRAILLTHRHLDHASNAEWFHQHYGTPVYAHEADAAILKGGEPPRRLDETLGFVGALAVLENRIPARLSEVIPLRDGDSVAGLEVIWMPGHTVGSMFLLHRETGTLFSGDMLLNAVPPFVTKTALSLPYPAYCDDYPQALASLERFLHSDLHVQTLCPGHGPMRKGNLRPELALLLEAAHAAQAATNPVPAIKEERRVGD